MPSRTTRVLAVLAVLAVAAFVVFELPQRRAREQAERNASALFGFDATGVDGVRVRRGGEELVFVRRDTGWEMLSPLADHAETSAVASLIQALHDAGVERNLGREDDDERFGLRAPAAVVWIAAGRDTVARLEIGRYTPDRAFVYARRSDGDIVLAPTDLHRAATLALDAYRSRRVVDFERAAVRSFELRNPAGASRWARSGPAAWLAVVAGDTIPGDSTAVEAVLRTLRGLRISRFLAPTDTARALDHAEVAITIERAAPLPSVRVRFRCPGASCLVHCDGETRVSEIADGIGVLMTAGIDDLRDRRLLHFAPERAGRIEISIPDTSAVLVRAGDAWAVPNPAMGTLDRGRTADFVRTLQSLRWTRIAVPAKDPPRGASTEYALVVYARDGGILDDVRGAVRGDPPVYTGRSRSSGLLTETDASAFEALVASLRRLQR